MELLKLVEKYLGQHKIKGKEIVVKKCVFCGKEKHKFSINTEKGLFQCFSGSCRKTGHIDKLYQMFKEHNPKQGYKSKELDVKEYVRPTNDIIIDFMASRNISKKTLELNFFDIMSTRNNEVTFIYRKGFDIHSVKVRGTKEKTFRGKKWKDLTLWKLDYCDTEKPLIICEGEMDQLSFEEQGIPNSVSVPAGASSLNWIDTDFEELEKFSEIIIAFDSDKAGKEATRKIIKRMPEEAIIKVIDFIDYKDANEVHMAKLELEDFVKNAVVVDEEIFCKMSDIDISQKIERFSTGSLKFNRSIGGIRTGEVNIWTGKAGSGKSTILNQVMLNAMQNGVNAWVYSPELLDSQYKRWTCRQLLETTSGCFDKYYDDVLEQDMFVVKKNIADKMSKWLDSKMNYVSSANKLTDKEIIKQIIKSIKRHNSKFIVIDNLMKVLFENVVNIYEAQKDFLNRLSEIAKRFNVSINLVSHPKKHDSDDPDQYDIAGTSNIPNLVDNIYYWRRITEKCLEKGFLKKKDFILQNDISTALMVLKSREGEKIGNWIFFQFDITKKKINHWEEEPKNINCWMENKELGTKGEEINYENEIPDF